MKAVLRNIRILVIILLIDNTRCQDGMNNGDVMRYQQIASNDGQIETITSYSTNIIQRDPSSQSISSVSVQYRMSDDNNDEFNRADRGRTRKVYHIKNPFQQDDTQKTESTVSENQDSGSAASNQYAAMQYSLPPEDFLQQMRAESQYYQQQQQLSTPPPNLGYTATPQPQYQYSTISAPSYDNTNQQSNQIQMEPKTSHSQAYLSNTNYQFNANAFSSDNSQSTPSPVTPFLSTSLPNSQFVGTPSNNYVSSSSPIFLSSSPNLQQYVSSPLSPIQVSSPTYGNRVSSTIGSNSINYDNDSSKKMLIDHYDNSANGVRYPANMQQYQNDYLSSTSAPLSSPYSDPIRESWQNTMNAGINALSKSLQEVSLSQYQNYAYNNNQQDTRPDSTLDSAGSDTHRIGSLSPANGAYVNYAQPDYQTLNNMKSRQRELQQESPQQELYSNGDYGWKLTGKKPLISPENYPANYPKYPGINSQSDGGAISQMNFNLDTGKSYNYDQNIKPVSENFEAQEFAKAAAKAQENMKQQQLYGNSYPNNFMNNNQYSQNSNANVYENNDKQKNKYASGLSFNSYSYSTPQPDLITASPYYYGNSNDNSGDNKVKQPFDHAKALKNIVPIDVSNVVQNNEAQLKALAGLDSNNRFNQGKDQSDQNMKQYYNRPIADTYYKDKNTLYGFNLKTKPDDFLAAENFKQLESNGAYFAKQQQSQDANNLNPMGFPASSQTVTYTPQITSSYPDSVQSVVNFQQQGPSRPQNQITSDIASLLKLNDLPFRITQGLPNDIFKVQNGNFDQTVLPTPLPMRINQNLGSHQLDVTSNLLSKLMLNKQPSLSVNRPEIDGLSTINGYKIANPYNVDLKLFAEMLKGKPAIDESSMLSLKDQFKAPIKLDLSQLQLLLRNENNANLAPISDGLSALSSPYIDIYNNGRFPYQGVKYSRSQEEEESIIPIADATNSHPIGAVMDQDDTEGESDVGPESDTTAQADESFVANYDEDRSKKPLIIIHKNRDRHRHPNALLSGRHSYQRKYPVDEPYPLLRPPPPQSSRNRVHVKHDKYNRQRRVTKPKVFRILKSEAMYEADADTDSVDTSVPILLRPPPPDAKDKSDKVAA
ncbi:transcription factor mef2A [Manduca sexta]|uniref:Uncharacterized protein n=1 Tax=Manduca sexta TaxID=7130 RepID=A0A922CCE4_MANSE|nr:transcription factor mef2A [Manduca sexta]KAG6440946.1 hypothetical protein O3G_MSEX001605 [Manduca sexta]